MTAGATAEPTHRVWFTTTQAAKHAGVHRETVLRAVAAGELKSTKLSDNGWRRYHRDWLETWISARAEETTPA